MSLYKILKMKDSFTSLSRTLNEGLNFIDFRHLFYMISSQKFCNL